MSSVDGNNGRLTSWKEIAAHLGCDVRTCARWEKSLGLPIHRLEGAPKSRVYAYRHELDAWMSRRLNGKEDPGTTTGTKPPRKKIPVWTIPVVAAMLVAAVFAVPGFFADRKPADFRIERSAFVVLNAKGRELWRYETGLENLETNEFYRRALNVKVPTPKGEPEGYIMPKALIRDIDGDGSPEILFGTQTRNDFGEGDLFCFDRRGKLLWKFHAGRAMTFGGVLFSSDYRIEIIQCEDLNRDGKDEIMVVSAQNNDFPTQLALLDAGGDLRGEYWNAGRMTDILCSDINGDGRKEILVGGVNNEYRGGCFIILDPGRVGGGSPQSDARYLCPDLKPGSELCYVIFPRTDIAVLRSPVEAIIEVIRLADDRIQLWTSASLLYIEMGFDLKLVRIRNTHAFEMMRREAVLAGRLAGDADEAYFKALEKGVLYWTGRGWSASPAWVSPIP